MQEATEKILGYCEGVPSFQDFSETQMAVDACVRNLQVLGDAAAKVPAAMQKKIRDVPWREIKGMRNLLVHEYFGVSPIVVWNTIRKDLPPLHAALTELNDRLNRPRHHWRVCPPGEVYVRPAHVSTHLREGSPVREHARSEHCREVGDTDQDILSLQEVREIAESQFGGLSGPPSAIDLGFSKSGVAYDALIRGWVQYWNDVFAPDPLLDPNLVKALIASESSFDPNSGRKGRKAAKGLMQLMPTTIRYLNGERGELVDYIFLFQEAEVYDPSLNIAAGVRWLFRKRETATSRLKRRATWEEAVEEYKDYLRRRLKNPSSKLRGMEIFRRYFADLRSSDSGGRR